MKTYRKPTMEIRNFISESVVTVSPVTQPDALTTWETTTGGTVVEKSIAANDAKAMKVMKYTF